MEWIIIGTIVLVILALAGLFALKAKHRPYSVRRDFHFDQHKASELNRRGLLDRTQWH